MDTRGHIVALVNAFEEIWPNSDYGPAHIVLSDFNLGDSSINWCLGLIKSALGLETPSPKDAKVLAGVDNYKEHSPAELRATLHFLDLLLEIPEDERDPEYDDEELF